MILDKIFFPFYFSKLPLFSHKTATSFLLILILQYLTVSILYIDIYMIKKSCVTIMQYQIDIKSFRTRTIN